MPDILDFLDALFADTFHRAAIFDDGCVVPVPASQKDVVGLNRVSPVTREGVAFVFGVMDDVEDDAYLHCKLKPHAALYRDGVMLVCWGLSGTPSVGKVEPLADALGMDGVDEPVPLPGFDGWRCVHAEIADGYTVGELLEVYGSPPAPAADPAPWEDETYRDAKVLTPFDPDDPLYAREIAFSVGRDRMSKQWKPERASLINFIDLFTVHRDGKKDGLAIVLGDMVPGQRLKAAVKTLYAVGLDIDVGVPTAVVDAALVKAGSLAIRASTHSHMKTETHLKKDVLVKWSEKHFDGADVDAGIIQDWLAEVKGWEPGIVKTVKYGGEDDDVHEEGGIMAVVRHAPMPKHRVIVPLAQPFEIAKEGKTQAEAMKRWGEVPTALAASLGLPLDRSCLDPSRLFYLPRHDKGNAFDISLVGGDLLDWRTFELDNPYAEIAKKLEKGSGGKSQTERGRKLGRWSIKAAHGFLINAVIDDHCPDRIRHQVAAGYEIECPFDGNHSNPGDPEDRACLTANGGDGPSPVFTVHCQHEACRDLTNLDMLGKMLDDGWFPEEVLESDDYNALDPSAASNPGVAAKIDREDKAAAGYQAAIDALSPTSNDDDVRAAVRLALEANLSTFDLDRVSQTVRTKLKVSVAAVTRLVKSIRAELPDEGETIEDPLGRKVFVYTGDFHFDEAFLACFRTLRKENDDNQEPAFCCVQEQLVRLNRTKEGRISFDEISARALWSELNNHMTFVRKSDGGAAGHRQQVPTDVANQVFEQAFSQLPQAPEVVYTPLFIPEGSQGARVITEPGWYKKSDLILADIGFTVPPVLPDVTADEVDDALSLLEDEVLVDFPFLDYDQQNVERREPAFANCLAMLITPFMRRLINSPTPVFFISKPIAGTGGTLLGRVPNILFEGEEPIPEPYTQNEEEMRKSLVASIMTARSHLFFDDVREFNNRVLLQSITSHHIGGRLLGASKTIERVNRFNWIATGNNPAIGSEMARRIVSIRLNAEVADIQKRTYRHDNLPEYLKANRARIVHAILTLIQNWVDAGMPLFKDRKRASFEDWSMKVGGVLMCAGIEGFLDNGASPTADMEEAAIKLFVRLWLAKFGKDNPLMMSELLSFAMEAELDIADGNNDDMKKARFAQRLPRLNGRVFNIDGETYAVRVLKGDDDIVNYQLELGKYIEQYAIEA